MSYYSEAPLYWRGGEGEDSQKPNTLTILFLIVTASVSVQIDDTTREEAPKVSCHVWHNQNRRGSEPSHQLSVGGEDVTSIYQVEHKRGERWFRTSPRNSSLFSSQDEGYQGLLEEIEDCDVDYPTAKNKNARRKSLSSSFKDLVKPKLLKLKKKVLPRAPKYKRVEGDNIEGDQSSTSAIGSTLSAHQASMQSLRSADSQCSMHSKQARPRGIKFRDASSLNQPPPQVDESCEEEVEEGPSRSWYDCHTGRRASLPGQTDADQTDRSESSTSSWYT